MDKEQSFKAVMASIATVYDKAITPELAQMYWETLSFAKPEHLQWALRDHMANKTEGRFMPKPAHLIAHIQNYQDYEKRQREIKEQIENSKRIPVKRDKSAGLEVLKKLKAQL